MDGETIGSVYLRSDLEKVYARLRRYSAILGLVTLAACLLALLFSSRLQRAVSKPILHLSETARLVSFGANFAVRATKQNNDELGVLTDAFNQMLTQIEELDIELARHGERLEEQVAVRTAELQTMNTELTAAKEKAEESGRLKSRRSPASGAGERDAAQEHGTAINASHGAPPREGTGTTGGRR